MGEMDEMDKDMPNDSDARLRVFRDGRVIELQIPLSATPFRDQK